MAKLVFLIFFICCRVLFPLFAINIRFRLIFFWFRCRCCYHSLVTFRFKSHFKQNNMNEEAS